MHIHLGNIYVQVHTTKLLRENPAIVAQIERPFLRICAFNSTDKTFMSNKEKEAEHIRIIHIFHIQHISFEVFECS